SKEDCMSEGNDQKLADIGVTGLAVMGANLARNFARNGFRVAIHNRSAGKVDALVAEHGDDGDFVATPDLADSVQGLERPRQLVPRLDKDDIIVDGGNAHWDDTRRREKDLRDKGLRFVGTGVSGGEEGALNGPSIMPGGDADAYASLAPMLEKVAAQVDGEPC